MTPTSVEYWPGPFLDKVGVQFKEGLWGVSVATGVARCSHLFLIVSANMASGKIVVRGLEASHTAMDLRVGADHRLGGWTGRGHRAVR